MNQSLLIAAAGLMGAAGVALAAVSAHAVPTASLQSAAQILMVHAPAVLAGTALLAAGRLWRPLGLAAVWGLVAGAALFSGTIALGDLAGLRPLPMGAPTGGTALILSWLALTIAALVGPRPRG